MSEQLTKEQVIDYLSNLPVLEVANLVKELEEKWGVSAAPVAIADGGSAAPAEEQKEEQTEFDIILESFGNEKMKVIKEVRSITQLGLKETKEKVESAGPDCVLVESAGKEQAEEIKKKLEDIGAKVSLK